MDDRSTDLLKEAQIFNESQVDMVKIQLKDVARTSWLAEEARLEKLLTWAT